MEFDFGNANEQQKEAIRTMEGPLLVIAGPGTGKTFTLVKRIAYMITVANVKPEEIMVATFTEKAAKELVTRLTNELCEIGRNINLNEMYVGTFHSICLRIIKENLEYTRFKKNYRVLNQFEQIYTIFQHIDRFYRLPHYDDLFANNKRAWLQAKEIAMYASKLLEEGVDIGAMLQDKDLKIVAIANILKEYTSILYEENLMDFTSIQTSAYQLLKENSEILEKVKRKVKYIMVDEYQDSNSIQEKLIFLLEEKNICVVGDDDQALYRFRGATIRNILEFPNYFKKNECKKITLEINYRSEKQIIDFYNGWMRNTEGFSWKKKFRFEKEISPGKKKYSTDATVVKCIGIEDEKDWYDNVYKFISELKRSGAIKNYNQIAFLCRSVRNSEVVKLIRYLEEKDIPVYSPRSQLFFERTEIKELLGMLIMCFPDYYSRFKMDTIVIESDPYIELYKYYKKCIESAKKILYKNAEMKAWHENIQKRHSSLSENTNYGFCGLLYQLLQFEPFKSYMNVNIGTDTSKERVVRNISILSAILGKFEFLHFVDVFTVNNIIDVSERFFNKYLKILLEEGVTEYEDNLEYAPRGCVSFMTIHQSKGMEFPVVMVDSLYEKPTGNNEGVLSIIEKKYLKKRDIFENNNDIKYFDFWRLYYTAFSRAQNLLVLTCTECYTSAGKLKTPSKSFEKMYIKLKNYDEVDFSNFAFEEVKSANLKRTFSFTSHVELYENCSLQYKFFKELGFTKVRVGTALFGSLIHETLKDINRAAMRHEEAMLTPLKLRQWIERNYITLSNHEHAYLGKKQIDAAYNQIQAYVNRINNGKLVYGTKGSFWNYIQDTEVDVSIIRPNNYILKGTVDLICGDGDSLEIYDFKSESKPDLEKNIRMINRYKRQLEVYSYLLEERTGKHVSKMHLYYTGEEKGDPIVTFEKSNESINDTIKEFDEVVEKIQKHEFITKANDKKLCENCDMRYLCGKLMKK